MPKNLINRFKTKPRWFRFSVITLCVYSIYLVTLGLAVPAYLKSTLPDTLSETLNANVLVGNVSINPFLLRAHVSALGVTNKDDVTPLFHFDDLIVDISAWRSIFTLTLTLDDLTLNGPYLHLARLEGGENPRFNVSAIVDHLTATEETPPEEESEESELLRLKLDHLALLNGHVLISDSVTGAELDYPELSVALTDLDTQATPSENAANNKDTENQYDFTAVTAQNGTISVNGFFQLSPLAVDTHIALEHFALTPFWPLIKDQVDGTLSDGSISFALNATLNQTADDLVVKVTDGQLSIDALTLMQNDVPKITLPAIVVDNINMDSQAQTVTIDSVTVKAPRIDTTVDAQGSDLQRLYVAEATPEEAAPTPTADASDEGEWQVILDQFGIQNGEVIVRENAVTDTVNWQINNIAFSTGKIDTQFTQPIDFSLSLKAGSDQLAAAQHAGFNTQGSVDVAEQQVSGSLAFDDFALAQLQPYIAHYANVTMNNGHLFASADYKADAQGDIQVAANARIDQLQVNDAGKNEPLLSWASLDVADVQFDNLANALSVKQVTLSAPYANIQIDENKQTNLSDLLREQPPSDDTPTSTAQKSASEDDADATPMTVDIAEVTITDGSAYFADYSLTPRFASGIADLNGAITQLSSQTDTRAGVDLKGKIDSYAPVKLQGELNPFLASPYLDLDFSVSGAELTSVNPYSGTYMGYYIDKGLMSLDVSYRLEDEQLKGENHLVIDQLTLGKKTDSEDALQLPLGLAVALLEDQNGVIDLGLEVSGDVNSPDFSFGSIILNAIGNIITKAVTAPFSLLASLVSSDEELNIVDFAAGINELDDNGKEKLTTLAEALKQRPGLRVNIEGSVDAVADSRELAEQTLQNILLTRSSLAALPEDLSASSFPLEGPLSDSLMALFNEVMDSDVASEKEHISAQLQQENTDTPVEDNAIQQALTISLYNQLRNHYQASEADLTVLADSRAKAVKSYLVNVAEVDANRLFLTNSQHHLQEDFNGVNLTLESK
ncbi:DUF748 domain-containing protein [Alteromonas sp. 14N.309.X.WAT.G.H12]|uniref:DUF748 domain-containing protein n=1 Tax=Alteromonas sp. 14N.309.X.WAT.G.H12 TaxID=3120824 RepID=UPI002FCF9E2A